MAINQKRLDFRTKQDCTVQDNMAGNGLGNRYFTKKAANQNFEVNSKETALIQF